jgi:hypothetical protein
MRRHLLLLALGLDTLCGLVAFSGLAVSPKAQASDAPHVTAERIEYVALAEGRCAVMRGEAPGRWSYAGEAPMALCTARS